MADPQGLTIDQLRELVDVESHLFFPMDAPNETFKVSLQAIIDYAREAINVTPTGSFIMWPSEIVPKGYIELAGQSFNIGSFPVLGSIFPSGRLPDTRGMMLKHGVNGRATLSFEAESIKSHSHTAQQVSHRHDKGSMNIRGSIAPADGSSAGVWVGSSDWNGALGPKSSGVSVKDLSSLPNVTSYGGVDINAQNGWTGVTSTEAPKVSVNASGSQKNLVDNIAVKFIVKQE